MCEVETRSDSTDAERRYPLSSDGVIVELLRYRLESGRGLLSDCDQERFEGTDEEWQQIAEYAIAAGLFVHSRDSEEEEVHEGGQRLSEGALGPLPF